MTDLMLRDPVDLLPVFTGQMNQLFKSPFSFTDLLSTTASGPAVTIYETANEYVLQAELPGWTRDQITINFENQTLTLTGQRELQNGDGRQYHRVEGFYGRFTRSFTLPGIIDADSVQAELKDGLLTIRLAKREDARPRQIGVRTVQ